MGPKQSRFLEGFRRVVHESTAVALLGVVAWMPQALAQDPVSTSNVGVRGYWTASRVMDAQPLDLPASSVSLEAMGEEAAEQLLPLADEPVSADGGCVTEELEVAPDLEARMFPEDVSGTDVQLGAADFVDVEPQNVGTRGAYFSSSRLVPTDARLTYPYRPNGKLFFTKPGIGDFICSAAVIRQRLVATAGHCVHSGSNGVDGFYTNFLFVPAYHEGAAPFQEWNWSYVVTTGAWSVSNNTVPNSADFALLEVADRRFSGTLRKIGEVTGWLGWRTNALMPNHTKKIGYPANLDNGEIQHQVDSESFQSAAQSTVLYGSDMEGGSSGGAWIENFGVEAVGQTKGLRRFLNRVVGIASYGFTIPGTNPPIFTDGLVQGSSTLNASWVEIWDLACAHKVGNCTP